MNGINRETSRNRAIQGYRSLRFRLGFFWVQQRNNKKRVQPESQAKLSSSPAAISVDVVNPDGVTIENAVKISRISVVPVSRGSFVNWAAVLGVEAEPTMGHANQADDIEIKK